MSGTHATDLRASAIGPSTTPVRAVVVELEDDGWSEFVRGRADATCFHDPRWARLIADCYGFHPRALLWLTSSGTAVAGLPLLEARSQHDTKMDEAVAF